jgi:hypothetical protein
MPPVGFLIGGAIVIAGVAYFIYKNSDEKVNNDNQPIEKLLSDENRYKGDKNIVQNAIKEKDWEMLEELIKDRSIKDFPDLIKIIEEALKGRK